MSETKLFLQKLFAANGLNIAVGRNKMFENFCAETDNISNVNQINELQKKMVSNWKLNTRIKDIQEQRLSIPNATVGKPYQAPIDFVKLGWNDIIFSEFEGLTETGLAYDNEHEIIQGTPVLSGDFKIKLLFRVQGEPENSTPNEKIIPLVINADPKSLWKTEPSNQNDKFWKEDNVHDFQPLGDKHIVVASKRGRSHANVGSFRDDDFAFKHFPENGWSVVAVSDGAGSAKASRKGSQIACHEIVNYFETAFTSEVTSDFDALIKKFAQETQTTKIEDSEIVKELKEGQAPELESNLEITESSKSLVSKFIYNYLGNAARTVHKILEEFANKNEFPLKDLHSTLIYTLFKKYDFGYVIMSFGVGDCPIGLINKDLTELKLMNWLDVGEFGGGTRFITMPEIFASDKFATRFGFKLMDDFSYLILMTDGIYDPKFVVEANLEKLDKWKEFLADLEGNNDEQIHVKFDKNDREISKKLSDWMDFWSPGNHDDRTLAIVF
jgi:serine/threonine protein phosphatase PrpC